MIGDALRTLWREPSVAPPPGRPWWDWALVAVLVPLTVLEGLLAPDVPWPDLAITCALVVVLSVLWRRTHPLAALVVAFGAQTVSGVAPNLAGIDDYVLNTTSVVLLLPYSLCRWARGRDVVVGLVYLLLVHFVREPILEETAQIIALGVGFLLFPAALGASVRFHRTARARALEQVRLHEREDLARELHDTVAHHVSGIVIQAQAGRAVAATDPVKAVGVLEVIEQAATRSLAEMRSLVGILRAEGDDDAGERGTERAPVPGAADLDRLVRDQPGPLQVELSRRGDLAVLDALEPTVGAALYRLAQESLTNAQRHARGATCVAVRLTGDAGEVRLEVADDGEARPAGGAADGAGYGLVGMAERVDLLGGTFSAGARDDGGWTVAVALPTDATTTDDPAGAAS